MTALLSFQDLAIARGDHVLLRGLVGAVGAGDILHIRGANGVGKTSLLEVLCGLRDAEQGEVTRAFEPQACHWIGHRNALQPALTPYENLRFWCALQGAPADGIRGALRGFDLGRVADQPCRQLSAGQKRRAALARLAVVRRDVWFLDEPLSGLDDAGIQHWLALLQGHQQQGGAAVITSHQALPAQLPGLRALVLSPDSSTRGQA
jgi:heme exporter protein A